MALDKNFHWLLSFEIKYKSDSKSEMRTLSPLAPLAFGLADPAKLPYAAILIAAFTLTGISFLAYAIMAEKRGAVTEAHGKKSFFYNTGLAEGTETIICFVIMCLFPAHFIWIAIVYAVMCGLTVLQRSAAARADFS